MSKQPSSTGPADGDKSPAAPRGTIFDQPAPAGAAKKTSEVLGEITWLMSQSPLHKQLFISDLEWLVMTPMLLQQFRLFYDKDKPIGVVFWASVSEEVEARLAAGNGRMRPAGLEERGPAVGSRGDRAVREGGGDGERFESKLIF